MNLGILASHRGTNFQAIIDACNEGILNAKITVAISNNSNALALGRAKEAGIPAFHLSGNTHPGPNELDSAILETLTSHDVDLVVLVGYLKKLGTRTLAHFDHRIVNIHPALLPSYGGKGMFGTKIHQAVLDNKESETGITMHYVDGEYDTGDIIAQVRVPVSQSDTVSTLENKILQHEHQFLIATLNQLIN
ncbi:MAG: phosphoribosylglycinamide formyltransferase [Gammaproteobacteria bacterium]|jgi:phosphoribosylglycinamide formyltransferase-1|nr:phosphoribosylglycinamide formyltransferase [Gammaproteobacteria bacterium]|tara:strand:- start:55 stop:630 length:576 start_codon:yes stop_codon:yes gene_type:complete